VEHLETAGARETPEESRLPRREVVALVGLVAVDVEEARLCVEQIDVTRERLRHPIATYLARHHRQVDHGEILLRLG